jgi:hypothetical protein
VHEGTDTSVQTSMLGIANKAQSDQITLVLLRKRVFTKSPVRENRTPGSVRGLPGNWQSYRDQLFIDHNHRSAQFLPRVARSALNLPVTPSHSIARKRLQVLSV